MRLVTPLAAVLICTLAPIPTLAWGDLGHRVACDIAFRALDGGARTSVLELVRADRRYRTFADACTWPDSTRDDDSYDWAKPYHFVNLPRGARTVSLRRDCQPRGCALAGIYRYAGVLRDPTAPAPDRVSALKFLGHFVADLHQPLHVSFAEDLGGNRIEVRFFGERSNLHAVWDSGMLTRAGTDWRQLGRELHAAITGEQRAAWAGGGPVEWANESHAIALDPATRYLGAETCCMQLGQAYVDANLHVIRQRLQQAGYRLAALLNRIWPE